MIQKASMQYLYVSGSYLNTEKLPEQKKMYEIRKTENKMKRKKCVI